MTVFRRPLRVVARLQSESEKNQEHAYGTSIASSSRMLYLVDLPTMVLAFKDNHEAAVAIPEGRIIDVIGPAEDDRFVVVTVDDEQFYMFASDLAARATQVAAVAH